MKDYPPYLDYPKERKPQTNYDRLISKTPEELAVICEDGCPPTPGSPICASVEIIEGETVKAHCRRCWLNWLKSPAKEEQT